MRLSDSAGFDVRGTPGLPAKHLMKASRSTFAASSVKVTLPVLSSELVVDGRFDCLRRVGLRSRLLAMTASVREKDMTMGIITIP